MLKLSQKPSPRKRGKAPWRRASRNSAGIYLVELLVAVVIGTMILFTLTSMLGTTLRQGAKSQNDVYAQETLNELLEFTRGAGYAYLDLNRGNHTLQTNKLTDVSGPSIRPLPVQLNFISNEWQPSTKNTRFQGVVDYKVEDGPDPYTIKVTITISWSDNTSFNVSQETGAGRTISASTIITKDGTDKYAPEDMLSQ